ncbi:MAG TPA: cupredoxin domain-containing protein, partial [Dehalococcoidia bacterium]|nr:cupredoxin domain-containing protein [Dehalococcoidia bacterium]
MRRLNVMRGADAYAKAAFFGIAIYVAAAVIILITILVISPSDAVFGLILLIPAAIAIASLRYVRRWGLLIAAILSGFGFVAFIADAGLILTTPKAFFDFLLTLSTLTGLGIAFIACLAGFVQYFRGPVGSEVSSGVTMALRGIAAAVFVASAISLVLTVVNATKSVSAEDRQGAQELTADDTKWSVETLEVNAGEPIRLLVKNDDPILHTFTLKDSARGLDIDVRLGPWSEQIVEFGPFQAGVYGFICRIEGHEEDMTGA